MPAKTNPLRNPETLAQWQDKLERLIVPALGVVGVLLFIITLVVLATS